MTGPLRTDARPSEEALLYGTYADAAQWVAYVGLGGRYAYDRRWHRWVGARWEECELQDVHAAVRRCLGAVYDRRMESGPTPGEFRALLRLMDVNWRLGPLMTQLRRVGTLEPVPV